jgi:hypothetical protein
VHALGPPRRALGDRARLDRIAAVGHDEQERALGGVVAPRDRDGVARARLLGGGRLDVVGPVLPPVREQHLLLARADREAVCAEEAEIAGADPVAAAQRGGLFRVVEVARCGVRPADPDLPDPPLGQGLAALARDAEVDAVERRPDLDHLERLRARSVHHAPLVERGAPIERVHHEGRARPLRRDAHGRLGEPVHRTELSRRGADRPESIDEGAQHGGRDRLGADRDDAHVAQIPAALGDLGDAPEQERERGGRPGEQGAAPIRRDVEPGARVLEEPDGRAADLPHAAAQHGEVAGDQPEIMEERQKADFDVVRPDLHAVGDLASVAEEVLVRERHAARGPRRARGELDERELAGWGDAARGRSVEQRLGRHDARGLAVCAQHRLDELGERGGGRERRRAEAPQDAEQAADLVGVAGADRGRQGDGDDPGELTPPEDREEQARVVDHEGEAIARGDACVRERAGHTLRVGEELGVGLARLVALVIDVHHAGRALGRAEQEIGDGAGAAQAPPRAIRAEVITRPSRRIHRTSTAKGPSPSRARWSSASALPS